MITRLIILLIAALLSSKIATAGLIASGISVSAMAQSTTSGDTRPGYGLIVTAGNIAKIDSNIIMTITRAADSIAALRTAMVLKSSIKRMVTYSGTTDGSGNYTVVFSTAFSIAPNVQASIVNGTDLQRLKVTALSSTGFTVNVIQQNTTTVALVGLVIVPGTTTVSGASVDVVVTEK